MKMIMDFGKDESYFLSLLAQVSKKLEWENTPKNTQIRISNNAPLTTEGLLIMLLKREIARKEVKE